MDKLLVRLEHCYGIRNLSAEFDFLMHGNVFSVYAANGAMKTSFANTFRDISRREPTKDRIWPKNKTLRQVTDETGSDIEPESVFVVEPYNEKYRSDRISTLLVDEKLRKEYEEVYRDIDEKVNAVVKKLKPFTGLTKNIKEEFASSFTHDPNEFFVALDRVEKEVDENTDSPLGDVKYNHIFHPKAEKILKDSKFRKKLEDYIDKYNELIESSTFFKRGVFTNYNASEIAKNLKGNGFFDAGHSVSLSIDSKERLVSTTEDLEAAIDAELTQILTDAKLKSAFDEIDKVLNQNAEHRQLRACLEANPVLITELVNLDRLRQKLWIAYLVRLKQDFRELLASYHQGKKRAEKIVEKATRQSTQWAHVIAIYNERFSVPFIVRMDNEVDVMLRAEAPVIKFDFCRDDGGGKTDVAPVEESQLIDVLSMGEKRALYILNIIFEVEARKKANLKTLFVIDDIADSFDYKNKYAIVEYLQEIREEPLFYQIVLSHNYDLHRTVSSRLDLKRESRRMAVKNDTEVLIVDEVYQNSPFAYWKKNLKKPNMLIASIPFFRNLAEYSGDECTFNRLTSLLHIKPDTDKFTVAHLEKVLSSILANQKCPKLPDVSKSVKNLIYERASTIASDSAEAAQLEEKIVLSIAIRLKAEEHMIAKIDDEGFWRSISKNQTMALIKRYRVDFPSSHDEIRLIQQVNLMTPENIHLNSFMFEPILDLSVHHLRKLYKKVSEL